MTIVDRPVRFTTECWRCGVRFDLGTVLASERWTEPALFAYVALQAHAPLCLGRLRCARCWTAPR